MYLTIRGTCKWAVYEKVAGGRSGYTVMQIPPRANSKHVDRLDDERRDEAYHVDCEILSSG